ncbi:hypothetical protein [Methylobacterium tardum]|uniref:hypothetical protein n=1 Tax=Methylobacterium tardum TaxID=374432 RepID=UPI0036129022
MVYASLQAHLGLGRVGPARQGHPSLEGALLHARPIHRDLHRGVPNKDARREVLHRNRSDPRIGRRQTQVEIALGERRQGQRHAFRLRQPHEITDQGREIERLGRQRRLD